MVDIEVSATDDKGATGSNTLITFNVMGELRNDIEINAQNFTISEAFPNPFNPSTSLIFNVNKEEMVKITIYDLLGNRIKNLVNDHYSKGSHSISWHARNNQGQTVSAGVYLYKVHAGEFQSTKKMILLK